MAESFGVKMGVEGEKEFKNALKEINSAFKVLGSEMNLVTSQFDKNDKSIQSLSARNGVLTKEIEAQKNKVQTLQAALENASSSFGEADSRTRSWQIQLNNAQADLNKKPMRMPLTDWDKRWRKQRNRRMILQNHSQTAEIWQRIHPVSSKRSVLLSQESARLSQQRQLP